MKPLVYWCRWHDARLRLHGRSPEAVWGELDFWKENRRVPFHYDLAAGLLEFEEEPGPRRIRLDEMGIELAEE